MIDAAQLSFICIHSNLRMINYLTWTEYNHYSSKR